MRVYLGFTLIPDVGDGMMSSENFTNRDILLYFRELLV